MKDCPQRVSGDFVVFLIHTHTFIHIYIQYIYIRENPFLVQKKYNIIESTTLQVAHKTGASSAVTFNLHTSVCVVICYLLAGSEVRATGFYQTHIK